MISPTRIAPTSEPTKRADDAAPEAVGQEDREVPDREAHHHPAEHPHQRFDPLFGPFIRQASARSAMSAVARTPRFSRGLGSSLSTRSSGVRSAAGSRCDASGRRSSGSTLAPAAAPRSAPVAAPPRAGGRLRWLALDVEVAHEFLELVARELLARLLRGDQAAAPRALAPLASARRPRARRPRVVA